MSIQLWPALKVDDGGPMTKADGDFELLFLREYPRLVNVAYRVLADRAESEDVAQEALWRFHRRYPAGREGAAGWLHAAAVHLALNAIRGRRRRAARETNHARQMAVIGDAVDPQATLELQEQRAMVQQAMARLPRRAASVLALRYGGLSYAEVADATGVGIGQIGTILRRAEVALRKEVQHGASE